jgi:hypothetical protein
MGGSGGGARRVGRAICLSLAAVLLALLVAAGGGKNADNQPPPGGEPLTDTGNDDEVTYVPSADEVSPETRELPLPPLRPNTPNTGKGTSADRGDFVPVYEPLKNPGEFGGLAQTFKGARLLESVSEKLNRELSLPADISLSLRECGVVNAMYEPDKRRVSLCYEYIDFFERLFVQSGGTVEDAARGIEGATYYTLYHEIGHSLIDVLDLPVTGREEDVVDQLSTYILVEKGGEKGEQMALEGARFWYLLAPAQRATRERTNLLGRALHERATLLQRDLLALRQQPLEVQGAGQCRVAW